MGNEASRDEGGIYHDEAEAAAESQHTLNNSDSKESGQLEPGSSAEVQATPTDPSNTSPGSLVKARSLDNSLSASRSISPFPVADLDPNNINMVEPASPMSTASSVAPTPKSKKNKLKRLFGRGRKNTPGSEAKDRSERDDTSATSPTTVATNSAEEEEKKEDSSTVSIMSKQDSPTGGSIKIIGQEDGTEVTIEDEGSSSDNNAQEEQPQPLMHIKTITSPPGMPRAQIQSPDTPQPTASNNNSFVLSPVIERNDSVDGSAHSGGSRHLATALLAASGGMEGSSLAPSPNSTNTMDHLAPPPFNDASGGATLSLAAAKAAAAAAGQSPQSGSGSLEGVSSMGNEPSTSPRHAMASLKATSSSSPQDDGAVSSIANEPSSSQDAESLEIQSMPSSSPRALSSVGMASPHEAASSASGASPMAPSPQPPLAKTTEALAAVTPAPPTPLSQMPKQEQVAEAEPLPSHQAGSLEATVQPQASPSTLQASPFVDAASAAAPPLTEASVAQASPDTAMHKVSPPPTASPKSVPSTTAEPGATSLQSSPPAEVMVVTDDPHLEASPPPAPPVEASPPPPNTIGSNEQTHPEVFSTPVGSDASPAALSHTKKISPAVMAAAQQMQQAAPSPPNLEKQEQAQGQPYQPSPQSMQQKPLSQATPSVHPSPHGSQLQQEMQQTPTQTPPPPPATMPPTNITAPALNPSPVPSPKLVTTQSGGAHEFSMLVTPPTTTAASTTSNHSHSTTALVLAASASMAQSRSSRKKTTADIIRTDLWNPDPAAVLNALNHVKSEAASEKARSLIARTGGLLAIVRALELHSTDAQIQIAGCQALEKLALDTENEIAIEQVGGVEIILSAMMSHFSDVSVQEAAWAALWNLTCSNASSDMTLDTSGGMQAIVAAMHQHMDSPAVQKNACGALANLCQNNPTRMQSFAEANGFGVIAMAMQRYWTSDPEVRAEACFAMTALCESNCMDAQARPRSSPTSLVVAPPKAMVQRTSSGESLTSQTSQTRSRYLPHRFGATSAALPQSLLHTGNLRLPTQPQDRGGDDDLRSLASLSYFEEEVFDD